MPKQNLKIEGMHCVSCANIIQSRLSKLPGIKSVSVNFATEKAAIDFEPEKYQLNE